MYRVRDSLIVERPWRTAYLTGVLVLASFWIGWEGLVIALLMGIDYKHPRIGL